MLSLRSLHSFLGDCSFAIVKNTGSSKALMVHISLCFSQATLLCYKEKQGYTSQKYFHFGLGVTFWGPLAEEFSSRP